MPEATSADYNLLDGPFRVRQAETPEKYTSKKEAAKRPFHDRLDGDSEKYLPPGTEGAFGKETREHAQSCHQPCEKWRSYNSEFCLACTSMRLLNSKATKAPGLQNISLWARSNHVS